MNQITTPKLKENEIYAGAIINPDGTGHHIILLDGDHEESDWKSAMDWAKEQGGDLPNRVESALLFNQLKDRFKDECYWTNEQHASHSYYAWSQSFGYGNQDYDGKGYEFRARAVRRLVIQ
ncbi:MAG: DUF1566 domain-containing protein [Hydrogenophaga sp.]|nr:DUF1566 domain-containing protein [Hydrogenophaga sp.]